MGATFTIAPRSPLHHCRLRLNEGCNGERGTLSKVPILSALAPNPYSWVSLRATPWRPSRRRKG
jgi:hypothetical protein